MASIDSPQAHSQTKWTGDKTCSCIAVYVQSRPAATRAKTSIVCYTIQIERIKPMNSTDLATRTLIIHNVGLIKIFELIVAARSRVVRSVVSMCGVRVCADLFLVHKVNIY